MTIQFVGYASTGISTSFIAVNQTFSIASLTGGIATSPQTGDLVVLLRSSDDSTTALQVSGYSQNVSRSVNTLSRDVSLYVAHRILGATPETSLSLYTPASENTVTIAMVFRGVDQTTPFDATGASATDITGIPNPPPVTSVTNNAVSVVLAVSSSGVTAVTSPTGYSASVVRAQGFRNAGYACFKTVSPAGLEDPSAFGGITATNNYGTAAATLLLRPAVSAAGGNIKVWNGSAWVAKPVKVWNGSAWVTKPVKRWNGSAWVTTPY